MTHEDVVWLNEVETPLMEEDGWWLIFFTDHFNKHFWYEIKAPDGGYIGFDDNITDIYEAIDRLHKEKALQP